MVDDDDAEPLTRGVSSPETPPAARWRSAGHTLRTRVWGDEVAVFDIEAHSTHLLGAGTYAMLRSLEEPPGARTSAELWRSAFDDVPSAADIESLDRSLLQMLQWGLLAPALD